MPTVTHHGRTTAYRRVRRDRPGGAVLLVHGSGGTAGVWSAQLGRLGVERPVVAVDLSGHGDSADVDTDPGPATLDAYAADLVAVWEREGAAALLGNSLGGAVVLRAVLDHGIDPEAIVLAGSGARLAVRDDLLDALTDDVDRAIRLLHGRDLLFHDPEPGLVDASMAAMRAVEPRVIYRDFATCDRFDVRDRLPEIAVPTLALTGEHDRLTPPRDHESLADGIDGGRSMTISGAAHLAMLEAPDAFNDAVRGFLVDVL